MPVNRLSTVIGGAVLLDIGVRYGNGSAGIPYCRRREQGGGGSYGIFSAHVAACYAISVSGEVSESAASGDGVMCSLIVSLLFNYMLLWIKSGWSYGGREKE